MISVNVRYYGAVREACDLDRETVEIEEGANINRLIDQLEESRPAVRDFRQRVTMAVNEAIAPNSTVLADGDTVVFIPQVAGG